MNDTQKSIGFLTGFILFWLLLLSPYEVQQRAEKDYYGWRPLSGDWDRLNDAPVVGKRSPVFWPPSFPAETMTIVRLDGRELAHEMMFVTVVGALLMAATATRR